MPITLREFTDGLPFIAKLFAITGATFPSVLARLLRDRGLVVCPLSHFDEEDFIPWMRALLEEEALIVLYVQKDERTPHIVVIEDFDDKSGEFLVSNPPLSGNPKTERWSRRKLLCSAHQAPFIKKHGSWIAPGAFWDFQGFIVR